MAKWGIKITITHTPETYTDSQPDSPLPYAVAFWHNGWIANARFRYAHDAREAAAKQARTSGKALFIDVENGKTNLYTYLPKPIPPRPSDSWEPQTLPEHINAPFIKARMDEAWERRYGEGAVAR